MAQVAKLLEHERKALRQIVGAMHHRDSGVSIRDACIQLDREISGLLKDSKVFDSPDGDANYNLKIAYRHFKKMAGECREGHASLVQAELTRAEQSLRMAAIVLQIYGLAP